jgi:hypothetical protein
LEEPGWFLENWAAVLAVSVAIALLYVFSALMIDLPMPFESKLAPQDEREVPGDETPPL